VVLVVKLVRLSEMVAHRAHALGKRLDALEQLFVFKVLEYFVPIVDGIDILQGCVKKWFQMILLLSGRDGVYNLIEI